MYEKNITKHIQNLKIENTKDFNITSIYFTLTRNKNMYPVHVSQFQ